MIEVVIIGKNEGSNVDNMIRSISRDQWKIHYVADRCTDDTIERLNTYEGVNIIDTASLGWEGRQVGRARNLGYSNVDINSDVIFLDGDRYVVKGDIQEEIERFSSYDIILFPLINDLRRHKPLWELKKYGRLYNGFYSCGLYIKRKALNLISQFQDGQIFDNELGELWGVEDLYLGDVCYHLGLKAHLSCSVFLNGDFSDSPIFEIPIENWNLRLEKRKKLNTIN